MIEFVQAVKTPAGIANQVADELSAACELFGITDRTEQAHLVAQCGHESALFTQLEENLNYSADALRKTWPNRFPGNIANMYARKPSAIASRAYSGRMGNGTEESGDGWRYRGRGYIQLTGKDNYVLLQAATSLQCVNDPDLIATHNGGALAAAWFWKTNGCGALIDDQEALCKRINGGLGGLMHRKQLTVLTLEQI